MKRSNVLALPVLVLLINACASAPQNQMHTSLPPQIDTPPLPNTATSTISETEALSDNDQIGTITLQSDVVEHGLFGGALKQLVGTDPLYDGDSLRILKGGESILDFGDSMQLCLFNNTELNEIYRTSAEGTPLGVQIYLALGGFTGKITEEGSQATVRTPGGTTITVFGTEFFVVYNPDLELTAVGNFDGSLEVASGDVNLPVSPGHYRNVLDGEEPGEEKRVPLNRTEFENRAREYLSPIDAAASFGGGIIAEATELPPTKEPTVTINYLSQAYEGAYAGTIVTIGGPYVEGQGMYPESFADFEKRTGIDIQYVGSTKFESNIMTEITAGNAPDILNITHPILLFNLVKSGSVIDINKFMNLDSLRANYNPCWLDMATMETPEGSIMAGIWHRYNTKDLVWYPKDKFEELGYSIPQTWEDMLDLSDQIVGDGGTPWCIGIESGSNTGWPATDWVEEIMLRTTSIEKYDQWTRGDLPFSSPEVQRAFNVMSDIWFKDDYVYGGRESIAYINYLKAPLPMFYDPPGCWMHKQASYITESFPSGSQFGSDYDLFYLPTIDEQYGKIIHVYGDIMVMINDRPEVRAVMEFLATGASTKAWLNIGGYLSPHNDTNLDWYRNSLDRRVAEIARGADCFRYDGSYLMPEGVGMDSFFKYITAYVKGAVDLETALYEIDNSWR